MDLAEAFGRLAEFGPMIRAQLREAGLPGELVYLPLVESEGKPGAVSRAGAVGLWQFMAPTARAYGLEVSSYVDERRDPVRATAAATRYLRDLYTEFGDWPLALAGYNAGAGRVRRAGPRTVGYWGLRPALPRETALYVPKFLAAVEIAREPAQFGIDVSQRPPLSFIEVRVPGGVSLESLAAGRGIQVSAVMRLNPHLVREITPPGRPWLVRLPLPRSTAPQIP